MWTGNLVKCLLIFGLFIMCAYYFHQDEIVQQSPGIAIMFKSNGTFIKVDARPIDQQMHYCDVFNPKMFNKCGEAFNNSWIPVLKRLNLSDEQISKMTPEDDRRILSKFPAFVTAFSDNHYASARKWVIPEFRKFLPNDTIIIIYDLGLNSSNLKELRTLPYVEIRTFNFSAYPPYFRQLYQFRWKPLVIAEVLSQYDVVFWGDAHFYWLQENSLADLLQKVRCNPIDERCEYSNAVFFAGATHSIFFATHKRTYDFLPIDLEAAKSTEMGMSGLQLIYGTKDVRMNVVKWYVLCALEEECMAPKGSQIGCTVQGSAWSAYGDCHRQDQSAVSILIANLNRYDGNRFKIPFGYANWS